MFRDEWNDVIDDFPYYAGIPGYIENLDREIVAGARRPEPPAPPMASRRTEEKPEASPVQKPPVAAKKPEPVRESKPPVVMSKPQPTQRSAEPQPPLVLRAPRTVEEKFLDRKKVFVTEIPVSGDSILLAFYDHAEIDGDSIALFLNGKMLHQHVLLKAQAFEFKLAVADLQGDNELTMVAENLGSIPPNTSLMIVWVNGERHEVRLESNENSSAMIRFTKKPDLGKH